MSLPEKVKEVRSVWEKTRNVGKEGKCGVLYLGILRKIVREDKRVNYVYLWSKRHYYVSVASLFSHHLLVVALPSGEAHGPILFLWMFSVSLWWMFLALIDWDPCSVSPRAARVSRSRVFSLSYQHHPQWLREQGFCLTVVSLVQCYLECNCNFVFTLSFFLTENGAHNDPWCYTISSKNT